jgi:phosphohistidine phosphatase
MTEWGSKTSTMQIYLLRHAIAEEGEAGKPDRDRTLAPEGRKKLKEVLRLARQADTAISLILTSPFRRARETADIVADLLANEAELLETKTLQPDGQVEEVWRELRTHKPIDSVMLVSHEPLLSSVMAFLLNSPPLRVDFKKSALVRLDVENFTTQPHGVLRWMITPKVAAGS